MNIIVTGGSGFVGANVVSRLKCSHNVFAPTSDELDLTNSSALEDYIKCHDFSYIINCAVRGGRRTKKDTADDFYNNLKIIDNLLNYVTDDCKLITFSSGAEIFNPASYYGLSKKLTTGLVRNKPNIANLRIYNVFGENGMRDSFVYNTIEKCLNNQDVIIWDDKLFDVFYINDLICIIEELIIHNDHKYREIDCVYDVKYKLSELAYIIKDLCKSNSQIIIEKDTGSIYTGCASREFEKFNQLTNGLINTIKFIRNLNE